MDAVRAGREKAARACGKGWRARAGKGAALGTSRSVGREGPPYRRRPLPLLLRQLPPGTWTSDERTLDQLSSGAGRTSLQADLRVHALLFPGSHSAAQVNAYDGVQIIDSLHMLKYHITSLAECNQGSCSGAPPSQHMDIIDPRNILRQKNPIPCNSSGTTKVLADGHTVTVIDVKGTTSSAHICSENLGDGEGPSTTREDNKDSNCNHAFGRHMYQPILPWLNGDGTINSTVYEGLRRRVIGYVMEYPGMVEEDVIQRMDVLNPQTCRTLLDKLISDKHLNVIMLDQPLPAAPTILRSLLQQDRSQEPPKWKKHYFANPTSTVLL